MKNKICLMFSGQGSQKIGMGKSLVNCSKNAKLVFECASDILHYNMFDLCTNENEPEKLFQTIYAQPAIVAVSLAALEALKEQGTNFSATVGHSLGSISAITAANVLNMSDCFKIVKARAEAMQQCEKLENGSMCAIIGSSVDEIENAFKHIEEYVICANFNGTNQIVVSGETCAIEKLTKILKEKNRRCIKLNVKAAFHSKLMEPATEPFKAALQPIEFKTPVVDLFSNVTGEKVNSSDMIKKLIIEQITSPVLFTQNLFNISKSGIDTFIELGPSKPLCSMVRATLKNTKIFNVCDQTSLKETLKNLEN